MCRFLFLILLAFVSQTFADDCIASKLEPYREYMEKWTYEGQDWSTFPTLPKSRFETFKEAFEHFTETEGKIVVELGTSRSFVHGGHPGCNSDDILYWDSQRPENWDWGAGFFTRMAAICLSGQSPQIHTVDIVPSHIERCKVMTQDYGSLMFYHVCSSLDFLNDCPFTEAIDLLYLDTGDMTPIEPTALLQLEEAKIIVRRNLISKNGYILIDDVKNQTPKKNGETSDLGKSKYSLPFLLENGFEIVMDEYQIILKRT